MPNFRVTIILVACLAILLFAAPAVGAATPPAKAPANPDHVEVALSVSGPDLVRWRSVQTWEGSNARDMRQSLDAYFGLANKVLDAVEVDHIETASERDLANATLPFLSMGGVAPNITAADVEIEGAEGTVESIATLSIVHVVEARVPVTEAGMRVVANTPWNGTLSLRPPEGLVILEGGTGDVANVPLVAGRDAIVSFGPALPPDVATPEPQTSASPAETSAPQNVPGPTFALTGLAAALAAMWVAAGRGQRRR